jgi:hypothetical protein
MTTLKRLPHVRALWATIGSSVVVAGSMLVGCSDSGPKVPVGVTVTGKVLKGGQPLKAEQAPPGEFPGEVIFLPDDPSGARQQEPLKPDGSFREAGDGKGIKPGKYRLAVLHFIRGRGSDGLNGAFSEQNTGITVDIPADKSGGEYALPPIELEDYKPK